MTAPPPGGPGLLPALEHFLAAWPLQLGRSALRALEAVAFGRLPPITGRVLDLGCGDGTFGRRVTGTDQLYGVDTDLDRLAAAARRAVRAVAADAASLPFGPESFDAVIANSTLEHLPDPGAAVRAAARVLRPGGRFICTMPLADVLDNLFFGAGPGGAGYRRHFTAYWRHVTMTSADGWADLIATHAPALSPVRRQPLESRRQTEIVDLLWSLQATATPVVDASSALGAAQRRGLAAVISHLLSSAEPDPDPPPYSAILLEYAKRPRRAPLGS